MIVTFLSFCNVWNRLKYLPNTRTINFCSQRVSNNVKRQARLPRLWRGSDNWDLNLTKDNSCECLPWEWYWSILIEFQVYFGVRLVANLPTISWNWKCPHLSCLWCGWDFSLPFWNLGHNECRHITLIIGIPTSEMSFTFIPNQSISSANVREKKFSILSWLNITSPSVHKINFLLSGSQKDLTPDHAHQIFLKQLFVPNYKDGFSRNIKCLKHQAFSRSVLRIRGRPVAKCDPLLGRAIQHNPAPNRPMCDPTLEQYQRPTSGNMIKTENMQMLSMSECVKNVFKR